jgi:hypothetical protein
MGVTLMSEFTFAPSFLLFIAIRLFPLHPHSISFATVALVLSDPALEDHSSAKLQLKLEANYRLRQLKTTTGA